jgi:predicted MFS family arabinose efflux permease
VRRAAVPFYALIFLTEVVWMAIVPVAPTYAEKLSLSKVETGTVLAAAGVTTLLVSLPIGVLADRIGTRALTIGSSALVTASTLGQGLAMDFWSLLVTRAAFGVALGTIWTAGLAWSAEASTRRRGPESLGVPVLAAGVGIMSGPAFAGVLADHFGVRVPFLVLGAACGLVTLSFAAGDTHETPYRREPLGDTLRAARRDRVVVAGVAVILLVGTMGGGINLLVPLELRHNGFSSTSLGLVLSGSSAIFVLGSAVVTRLGSRVVTLGVAGTAALLYGASSLIPVASASSAALVAFLLVRSPFWAALSTLAYPLGGLGADRADVGRGAVMGLMNLVWGAAASLAPIVAGALAETIGEQWVFAALVACALGTGVWLLAEGGTPEPAPSFET